MGGEHLTRGTRNLVDMAGDFTRGDDWINTTGLDDGAAHAPERIRETSQGAQRNEKK